MVALLSTESDVSHQSVTTHEQAELRRRDMEVRFFKQTTLNAICMEVGEMGE
jgi:hypothetical protein